jgi:hypothetical protein
MRVVIICTPSAPRRANRKSRELPFGAVAADKGETDKDVIAARGLRPVLDAHAVFESGDGRGKGARVGIRRGHGKPHAASTCYGMSEQGAEWLRCPVNRVD